MPRMIAAILPLLMPCFSSSNEEVLLGTPPLGTTRVDVWPADDGRTMAWVASFITRVSVAPMPPPTPEMTRVGSGTSTVCPCR